MQKIHLSLFHSLTTAAAIILMGASLTAQAGQIPGDPDGWNRANVNVRILDALGNLVDSVVWPDIDYSAIPPDGTYESDIYDRTFIDGFSNEILMATLVARNPPVGIPPGLKVLNEQVVEPSQPENCIMATAAGIACGSGFQTDKRFEVLMQPTMVDGSTDSVDLVFDANAAGGNDPVERYSVFQKINNWTGERLTGFTLELGFGTGTGFQSASGTTADLTVSVDQYFTDPDKKTNFAHGLFGPIEPSNWGDAGAFTGGFFDDQSRAGFRTVEVNSDSFRSVPDSVTAGIFGKYENVLPEDPNSPAGMAGFTQFGPWMPTDFLPQGMFFDHDDNPNTDDVLMAWWGFNANCTTAPMPVNTGNYCWMYGHANYYNWIDNLVVNPGFVKDVIATNYQPVSQVTFDAWATDSRYYIDTVDGLANLNLNYVVNVGTVDANWPTWDNVSAATFTIRVTPLQDVNPANRTAQPGYLTTPHIPLINNSTIGTVDMRPNPEFVPGTDTFNLEVADADLNTNPAAQDTVDVVVENLTTGEVETAFTLTETDINTGVFVGTLPTGHAAADPDPAGADDNGIIYADHGEAVQMTYVDSNPAATWTASTVAIAGHDGTVQFTAPVIPGGNILIQVDDLDLSLPTITVTVENLATNESEVVTLFKSPFIAGQYVGSLLSSTDAADAGDDSGTLVVAAGNILEVTYVDNPDANGNSTPRGDTVTVTAAPGGGGGGGCTIGQGGSMNPTMPALLLMIFGLGWLRYLRRAPRA